MAVAMVALALPVAALATPETSIGLPITRNYTFDEIGEISRGVRLGFDPMGRLAVLGGNAYFVLNDTTWLEIPRKSENSPVLLNVVTGGDGVTYFGALAAWGVAEYTADGKLLPHNLRPQLYPDWVAATNFTDILPMESGVYFGGVNGVAYWDRMTREQVFFNISGISRIFALGSRVFASSHSAGIQYLDLQSRSVEAVHGGDLAAIVVDHATALDEGRAVLATNTGRLLLFDGKSVAPWSGPLGSEPSGRVSGMQRLPGGGVALAVDGRGLFIVEDDGGARLSLTTPEYHRIHDVAVREDGVLWVATEGVVQKLLYGSPVTIVDRRLGVPIGWPQVVQWDGRTHLSSRGLLYEAVPTGDGLSIRFRTVVGQPQDGVWAIAASGSHMLVGNRTGAYARDGNLFEPVLTGLNVNRLVMVSPVLCYAIGATEIAALRWEDGRWSECAPRVPGVGFPAVVHAAGASAWIELGANLVARVTLGSDGLRTRVINEFPWTEPRWVNIGVVGSMVVLSGGQAGALFFDEETGDLRDAPELRRLLASAPFPIARILKDARGIVWASHEKGVFVLRPSPERGSGKRPEDSIAMIVRDFQPLVQITGNDDIWISTEKTLYHVTREFLESSPPRPQPFLLSVTDQRTGTELYTALNPDRPITELPYAQNSLAFRFFSGSYAAMLPPAYEFELRGGPSDRSIRSTDSLLVLHDLKEGAYRLTARLVDQSGLTPEPVVVDFAIAPPWHRSPLAYASYSLVAILGGWGLFFWTTRYARRRNAFWEHLVRERTEELRSTMIKLNEETRNAATLAERNRLAGEIHDSLQQGLSGLMLQLDATLKLSQLTPDLRSRLTVARNMVSFTRQEVQQAVWDLESPLLENADLPGALKKLAGLISAGKPQVEIRTRGASTAVPSSTTHQLLRIAQEALTNAVRHGHARKIFVNLEYGETDVSLEIFDDGRGFVPQEVFASGLGHFGLRGLRGRASKINADLQIISAPNRGTTVRVVIPLAPLPPPAHATVAKD